jgi:hypothetical protein
LIVANIDILGESEIGVYPKPNVKVQQRVITYQVEGMAPRTLWIDRSKLPDLAWQDAHPGGAIPDDVRAQGDAVRLQAINADIEKIKQAPQPRRLVT